MPSVASAGVRHRPSLSTCYMGFSGLHRCYQRSSLCISRLQTRDRLGIGPHDQRPSGFLRVATRSSLSLPQQAGMSPPLCGRELPVPGKKRPSAMYVTRSDWSLNCQSLKVVILHFGLCRNVALIRVNLSPQCLGVMSQLDGSSPACDRIVTAGTQ